jgi:hypothetical protein
MLTLTMPKAVENGGGRAGVLVDGRRVLPRYEGDRALITLPRDCAAYLLGLGGRRPSSLKGADPKTQNGPVATGPPGE